MLRTEIIERHGGLIRTLAHTFARPGVPIEDLVQSAWVGLIGALGRFDTVHGTLFSSYAAQCAIGEIKHYLRDSTWALRVPRQLQEIFVNLVSVQGGLCAKLGREPTMAEMAQAFGITEEYLAQAMEVGECRRLRSLQERLGGCGSTGTVSISDATGRDDPAILSIVANAPLHAALARLVPRERLIVGRRFCEGWTQQEVASALHLSQVHISRIERSALRNLKDLLTEAC